MGVEEAAILLMALSSSSRSTLLHGQEDVSTTQPNPERLLLLCSMCVYIYRTQKKHKQTTQWFQANHVTFLDYQEDGLFPGWMKLMSKGWICFLDSPTSCAAAADLMISLCCVVSCSNPKVMKLTWEGMFALHGKMDGGPCPCCC